MKPELCKKCGHPREQHHHDKACLYYVDPKRAKYCPCKYFLPEEKKSA